MNNLLIDTGNSCIKIGSGIPEKNTVKILCRFSYSKNNFENDFESGIKDLVLKNYYKNVGISNLKEGNEKFLNYYFKKYFDIKPVFINRNQNLPLKINYQPGLGNDRICSAVAANEIYKRKNILIIDFGSATTFTVISDNFLIGGIISPGIQTSLNSLTEKTSLPNVKLSFPAKLINNNTSDNIKAGVLYQSLYSAERIIQELKKKYIGLFVIATGGFSGLISEKLKLIDITDKNLVLKGINIIISK